jgi:hypothetical protein
MRVKTRGRAGWMGLEVIDAQPPSRSTVESVGARGRWRTRGTYTLEELAEGGTQNHLRARVAADAAERTFDSAAHPRSGASQQREVAPQARGATRESTT